MPDAFFLQSRPADATMTVTKAAQVLGVHPNTVRAWSDAGRLRYYRMNPRGDRRYRMTDLQHFLAVSVATSPLEAPLDLEPSRRRRAGRGPRRGQPGAVARGPGQIRTAAVVDTPDRQPIVRLLEDLDGLTGTALRDALADPDAPLQAGARIIRDAAAASLVSVWRLDGEALSPVAVAGGSRDRFVDLPRSFGILGAALSGAPEVLDPRPGAYLSVAFQHGREVACAIPGDREPWGVLLLAIQRDDPLGEIDRELIGAAARALGNLGVAIGAAAEVTRQMHRSEALRRVAADIGSRLDLEQILAGVVDHALVLLGGDRAAVFLFESDGSRRTVAARGLSATYQAAVHGLPEEDNHTLASHAVAARRPLFAVHYRDDPRAGTMRAAIIQEGFDTAGIAPLLDGDQPGALGVLSVYHDRPHPWTEDELETVQALANQAAVAIKAARTYQQLATWAAQLQSIQQLGARLSRLSTVAEIGTAIATELRQLIDYHNVRVYRLYGDDLIPVAMQGQVGEYVDETPDQLRVKFGQGITGWVAEHRLAQLLDDADSDPRTNTIAGTDPHLDESMLIAPMLFEDEVLGVLVLSKLGLRQFQPDDLRLLVIYASFAAQAMANADATERVREQSAALEQKVRSQRELLRLTESILTTYEVSALIETTADRLLDLIACDNLVIEVVDPSTRLLAPRTARGRDRDQLMSTWDPGETGLATWVIEHNVPQLIDEEFDDRRVNTHGTGPVHGALVCVPLRSRTGATGVITAERLGEGRRFTDDEFELVQLFAAQVSIGLQNAEAHQAVEQRARTDVLTGLLNHGTFVERMNRLIGAHEPFSLVMLDLDRFKGVNDGFGHLAGDRLLRQVADAIVRASRETDAVFRYGGDEFAVLLPGTTAREVGAVAERIRGSIAATVGPGSGWRGRARALEASAGTASFPDDGATPEEVLLAADRACFVAKRSGGGRLASAAEGLAIAGELTLQTPTPIDPAPEVVTASVA
ncbi:MAG TPA: GAF domain-containing protein [Candidatus Limnocylindrales bacterium]|nr:GAF domain-containing protein [Candidatus Limnocylindrales bacterium]